MERRFDETDQSAWSHHPGKRRYAGGQGQETGCCCPRSKNGGCCRRKQGNGASRRREAVQIRSEEHTSELQSLMRISYAVFCLKKKKTYNKTTTTNIRQ